MAKKKSKKICLLPALIGVILVIVAFAFLFAPGIQGYTYATIAGAESTSYVGPISGFELFANGITDEYIDLQAFAFAFGVEDFGPYVIFQIALALLAVGIVLPAAGVVLGIIRLKKLSAVLETLGGVAAVVAGVIALFALNIIGVNEVVSEYEEVFGMTIGAEVGFQLMYGLWITGLAAILGGLASGFAGVKNIL